MGGTEGVNECVFSGAEAGREEDGGGPGPTVPGPDREDPNREGEHI